MRDIDPTASEYISSGYLQYNRPGGRLYDPVTATIATVGAGLVGSKLSSDASRNAAATQAEATNNASAVSQEAARESNALQREMFDRQVALQEPFRQAGLSGQNRLLELLALGGNPNAEGYGSANAKFQARDFNAQPFTQDPSYQWRLQQGQQALERSAAARGGLLSGRAAKDLTNYAQGAASQEYGNAYGRFQSDEANRFNRFQTERANQLNPLQSLSGQAQTASNTIDSAASNYGANVGNTLTNTATAVGNNLIGAGNANASGYVGSANAINSGIGQGINAYQNYNLMNRLFPTTSNDYSAFNDMSGINSNGTRSITGGR